MIRRVPNNTSGHYKRAVAISIDVISGNIGGIISSNVFRMQDAPHYKLGRKSRSIWTVPPRHGLTCPRVDGLELLFIALGLITTPITVLVYMRINARRDALQREANEKGIKYSPEEIRRLGDRAPDFRYTL